MKLINIDKREHFFTRVQHMSNY